jgi:hypothetical protein
MEDLETYSKHVHMLAHQRAVLNNGKSHANCKILFKSFPIFTMTPQSIAAHPTVNNRSRNMLKVQHTVTKIFKQRSTEGKGDRMTFAGVKVERHTRALNMHRPSPVTLRTV